MEGFLWFHIEIPVLLFVAHNAESNITDAEIDPSLYTIRRQLSDRLVLHARIVGVSFINNYANYRGYPCDTQS